MSLCSKTGLRRAQMALAICVVVAISSSCALAKKRTKMPPKPIAPVASAPNFADWNIWNYKKRLAVKTWRETDGNFYLSVHGTPLKGDSAWSASSPALVIPEGAHEFVVSFDVKCKWALKDHGKKGDKAENSISWFDADGNKISVQGMPHMTTAGSSDFERIREWGKIPEGAKSCKVKVGFNSPNLKDGDSAQYRAFSFETVPAGQSRATEFEALWRDNAHMRAVFVNRGPATTPPAPPPGGASGIEVKLRDDGFATVDGKPFFPIGVYNVKHATVNSNSLDRAFADLKAVGFNMAQTYVDGYAPEFLEAAKKNDMKLWVSARRLDERFYEVGRRHPQILAWYIGDDSSHGVPPLVMRDNNAAIKAADPLRITCQADSLKAIEPISNYAAYVTYSDVFMPEIYPVYGHKGDPSDATCVARTIMDMKCIAKDVRQFNDGRPRACWPILQYFSGWNKWFHFPTREQLFAMTWASVVHGANGVMYFIYNGTSVNKKTGRKNCGITETPETWRNISELTTTLKEWSPILLERTPAEQPKVEILEGPKRDPLDIDASVTCLYKVHDGKGYLIAVNACPETVKARFTMPGGETFEKTFSSFEVLLK